MVFEFNVTFDIEKASVAILNTCAFIKEAKEESISCLFEDSRIWAMPFPAVTGSLFFLYSWI